MASASSSAAAAKNKKLEGKNCAHCDAAEGDPPFKACSRCKLVFYCSKECQALDWKRKGGHKAKCIPLSDRKPPTQESLKMTENDISKTDKLLENCPICLDVISPSSCCKLPCSHRFHSMCISQIHSSEGAKVCPLCRSDLLTGPYKAFAEGCNIYFPIRESIQMNQGTWKSHGKQMAQVEKLWKYAAEEGDPSAQLNLGVIYSEGHGVPQNVKLAMEFFEKSASNGNAGAQNNISRWYLNPAPGMEQNLSKAFLYASQAAEQDYGLGQFKLSLFYAEGLGVKQNDEKSFYWMKKASDAGVVDAHYLLANYYSDGKGVMKSELKAVKLFEKGAEAGDVMSQVVLGNYYRDGHGVSQNYKKALYWYSQAATLGFSGAQYNIARLYFDGIGVKQDYELSAEWLLKAVVRRRSTNVGEEVFNDGWPEQGAFELLGYMYKEGLGVKKSILKAIEYTTLGANQGDAACQFNLSELYGTESKNTKSNIEKSIHFLKLSAKQNNIGALVNLGLIYSRGKGSIAINLKESAKCFQLASDLGNMQATYNLGLFYEQGSGVPQSYEKAFKYYNIAAKNGHVSAQFCLAQLYYFGTGCKQNNKEALKWATLSAQQGNSNAAGLLHALSSGGPASSNHYTSLSDFIQDVVDTDFSDFD